MDKILHIIPYHHLFPPKNGGQLRCMHLLEQVSKQFKVDVICYQPRSSIKKNSFYNTNIQFYSPQSFAKANGLVRKVVPKKLYNAGLSRIVSKNLFESAGQEVLEFQHIIKSLKGNDYKYIILEHIRCLSLVPLLKQTFPDAKRILDAHNVDHLLLDPKDPNYPKVLKNESKIAKKVDAFLACSVQDVAIIKALNSKKLKGYVVPNGVDIKTNLPSKKQTNQKQVLFCGSLDYAPNKNGLLWFYDTVWSTLKETIEGIKLTVIGRGSADGYAKLIADNQINFIGEVDDVAPYYLGTNIAIVPIFEGSGTRLKVLEAMSYCNAMVTTSKGIEGIHYTDGVHALTADSKQEFIEALQKLINNEALRRTISENARQLVQEKYAWDVIGDQLNAYLNELA